MVVLLFNQRTWIACNTLVCLVSPALLVQGEDAGVSSNEETCRNNDASCSQPRAVSWTVLSSIPSDKIKQHLACDDINETRDVGFFCKAMQPKHAICDFTRVPSSDEDFLCWYRCLYESPDLNLFDVEYKANVPPVAKFVPMSVSGYRSAPFLDHRSLAYGVQNCNFSLNMFTLMAITDWTLGHKNEPELIRFKPNEKVNFIFHLSHTGSTLLSRAIQEAGKDSVFVLREPKILKVVANHQSNDAKEINHVWGQALPWVARRYSNDQTVLVKATSIGLRLMHQALTLDAGSRRAVFMYSGLRTHLAVCLARPQERFPDWQYEVLPIYRRAFRKYSVHGETFQRLTVPQRMGLAWLKRMLFVRTLPPEKVLHLSMADFMDDPVRHLMEVGTFLGIPLSKSAVKGVVAGPVFREYAKDTSVAFDHFNYTVLIGARLKYFHKDVQEGLEFVQGLLEQHPTLRKPAVTDLLSS